MASWRKRIGLIVPDVNIVAEPEVSGVLPAWVSLHCTRARYDFEAADPLGGLVKDVLSCVGLLKKAKVDVIGFACTGASFYRGYGWDEEINRNMRELSGVEAATTSTAVVNSIRRLKARRIGLATPNDRWVIEKEEKFLADNKIQVVRSSGLGVRDGGAVSQFGLDDAWRVGVEADDPSARALFISCTNFETFPIIPDLCNRLGKPVISSNLATAWELLLLAGVSVSYEELVRKVEKNNGERGAQETHRSFRP